MANYAFFQNQECEYFPCHKGVSEETFNCLLCFCPLYCLGENCGGSFTYLDNGVKDCSGCVRPHRRENYEKIMEKMAEVMEIAKRT